MTDATNDPVAKPWYQSTTVLAMIAGIILALGVKLNLLPASMTQDQIVDFLLWVVPLLLGLYGRLTATHVLTATPAAAKAINTGDVH